MNATVDSLGFQLPHEDASATAGNARRWERYSLFSQLPLGLGVLSVGYVFTVAFAQRFNLDNTSVDETELQDVK
ncbi:MAG: hypothetical protein MK102_14995 [Fuerstiella sp.]|nr:hypothetical protein [Fuerstiella sp.]